MGALPLRGTARVLRALIFIAMAVLAFVMLLVPGITVLLADGGPATATAVIMSMLSPGGAEQLGLKQPLTFFLQCYLHTWGQAGSAVLTLFYWVCGACCLVILWQGVRVLDTLLRGAPFCRENGVSLRRAAAACWVISGCAVLRAVWWFQLEGDLSPPVHLQHPVHPRVLYGGPAPSGHGLPVPAGGPAEGGPGPDHLRRRSMKIVVNLDVMMARRKMSLSELAQRVDITMANLSILKNNKARAIRFSTLAAICDALDCQPGDILEFVPDADDLAPGKERVS